MAWVRVASRDDDLRSVEANLTAHMDLVESSIGKRVASLEDAAKAFDTWRPKVNATVDELRAEVGAIRKTDEKVETLREEMTVLRKSVSRSVLDAASAAVSQRLSAQRITCVVRQACTCGLAASSLPSPIASEKSCFWPSRTIELLELTG